MRCVLLKLLQQSVFGCTNYIVDLVYLVKFIVAWKERVQRYNFKQNAAYSPDVHFVAVVTVRQQTFRSTIPPRRNVLSVGLFTINASATTKVCQFNLVVHY